MFKDLCLLHLKDNTPDKDKPLIDILNDPDMPLTWRELQLILGHSKREQLVESMASKDRINSNQHDFAHKALKFLHDREPIFCTGIHDNIYHLVWSRFHGREIPPSGLYRGHADYRWHLESSFVRPDADGLRVGALSQRMRLTSFFVEKLRKRQSEFFSKTPTDEQLVAVAQHYGFPTGMLDFTKSLKIAAFFATSSAKKAKAESIGAIFELFFPESDKPIQDLRESPSFGDFNLLRATSVRMGKFRLIEPPLTDEDNRIDRQEGVFITDYQPRDLQHALSSPMFFRQVPGEVFEDITANIYTSYLLDDNSPLAQFASETSIAFKRKKHNKDYSGSSIVGLGNMTLPDLGIIGSNGGALQAVLTDGQSFLRRLQSCIEEFSDKEYIRSSVVELLDGYFALTRIRAEVGQNAGSNIQPLHISISKLSSLSQIEEKLLWSVAKPHLTIELRKDTKIKSLPNWEPVNEVEHLAASIVLYLAAWEQIQFIDGDAVRDTVSCAIDNLNSRRIRKITGFGPV